MLKSAMRSNLLTALLTACAVIITALVVRREFFPSGASGTSPSQSQVVHDVRDWEDLHTVGNVLGSATAPLKIVEFSDFQCPYCARVQPEVTAIIEEHAGQVAFVYRHYPLESLHPHAFTAALAAECAAAQGHFKVFHDTVFRLQDSIGLLPWRAFGARAKIQDLDAFDACIRENRFRDRVLADMRDGKQAGVRGTPSFGLAGTMVTGSSAIPYLRERIRYLLAERLGLVTK